MESGVQRGIERKGGRGDIERCGEGGRTGGIERDGGKGGEWSIERYR